MVHGETKGVLLCQMEKKNFLQIWTMTALSFLPSSDKAQLKSNQMFYEQCIQRKLFRQKGELSQNDVTPPTVAQNCNPSIWKLKAEQLYKLALNLLPARGDLKLGPSNNEK